MIRSEERILTTHVGSLPRPDDLIQMMFAKEEGIPVDRNALDARVSNAVSEIVASQAGAGVDIINDGEMSKPSYATYIKDRLAGFGGESNTFVYQDVAEFPKMAERVFNDPGRSRRKTPGCNGEISVMDRDAAETDVTNLLSASEGKQFSGRFLTAASPGVISLFFANTHYPDFETYIFAIADAMRHEYETVTSAGIMLQLDCPDLAMGRHIQYADLDLKDFRKRAELHVDALNHALENVPKELVRIHLCWGNYEGPHHCDVPLADIIDVAFRAKASGISFEAANPRHAHEYKVFDDVKVPDDVVLVPGVIESKSNFIEHPDLIAQRIIRIAKRIGREKVIAGSDCGYGTWVGQAAVEPEIVWAKLGAMAEGARLASERLWG
ncbi:MAG: cobalamin-independent methionine synthase II family protein [Pseudomonadota bacterium]|nr:cobalamin-independent methionine synthase II family protein [Pseudomonadota bacterium]|tara:strand:+ start:501 stop:1646 length:1146 start_codon:yes stop_codon:yes gene_type:complete